jgi:hypothetical protein
MIRLLALLLAAAAWAGETAPPPIVYVPYDKLPALDPAGSGVVLPYAEFRRLWEAAQRPDPEAPRPPGAALVAYELSGAVEGERALLRLTGTAVAVAPGWSRIPLPDDLAVSSLRGEDDRLMLSRDDEGLHLNLPGPGTWRFVAEVAAPVARRDGGGRSLGLVLPPAGAGRLDLLLPESDAELALTPQLAVAAQAEPQGGTRLRAVVGGQGMVRIDWRAPVSAAAGEALILAETRAQVAVGARAVATTASVALQILRRPVAELLIELPEGAQVLAVEAPGLRTWEVAEGRLRLLLHEPAEGALALQVRLERLLPAAAARSLALGLPLVVGAGRQTGVLVLRADEGIALTVAPREGLSQLDPAEAGAAGAVAAFRFLSPPPPLAVEAVRLEPDLRVQQHQLVRLGLDETRIEVAANLNVRRAGIFALAAALPEGWELIDAEGLPIDDARVVGEGAQRRLEVQLRSRLLGEGQLRLRFRAPAALPRQGGAAELPVGVLAFDGARVARGVLAVAAPRSWALSALAADGLAGADLRALAGDPLHAGAVRTLREDDEVALAWNWLGAPRAPRLGAAPRSRELGVIQEELVTVAEDAVRRTITWRGEVRYAAAETLRLRLPAALAAGAQIRTAGLAERSVLPAVDGVAVVELRYQTPLLGAFTIVAELVEPLPRLEAGRAHAVTVPMVALDGAVRRGVVVAVARDGSLTVAARAAGLDSIATTDLPATLQAPGAVAAYRGAEPGSLELSIERHDLVRLADAAVRELSLRAVLGEDGRLRVAGQARVVNRGRPHLELRLPAGAELLELAVEGRAVRPSRRTDGSLLVALGGRSGPVAVAFAYESGGFALPGAWGALALALPTVGGAADGQALPVEATTLSLWLPARYAVLGAGGDLALDPPEARSIDAQPEGLTVSIPAVGAVRTYSRLGDGGGLRVSLAHHRALDALAVAVGLVLLAALWLLRRRAVALVALAASGAVLVALGSGGPFAGLAWAGGIATALVAVAGMWSAWRQRRAVARTPAAAVPAADPWDANRP